MTPEELLQKHMPHLDTDTANRVIAACGVTMRTFVNSLDEPFPIETARAILRAMDAIWPPEYDDASETEKAAALVVTFLRFLFETEGRDGQQHH